MEKQPKKPFCRSVFKDGKRTTSKAQFTQKWTEIINTLEKRKAFLGKKTG